MQWICADLICFCGDVHQVCLVLDWCGFIYDRSIWLVDSCVWQVDSCIWLVDSCIWVIDNCIWLIDSCIWPVDSCIWLVDSCIWLVDSCVSLVDSCVWPAGWLSTALVSCLSTFVRSLMSLYCVGWEQVQSVDCCFRYKRVIAEFGFMYVTPMAMSGYFAV